ncbi:MAG: hypothetical protein ACLP7Q_13370 [Isosphaeraceae bacterium]
MLGTSRAPLSLSFAAAARTGLKSSPKPASVPVLATAAPQRRKNSRRVGLALCWLMAAFS